MKLLFVGDASIHHPENFRMPASLGIVDADFAVLNFEGAEASEEAAPICKAGPHVRQAAGAVAAIKREGFHVAALANNHIMDYGRAGFDHTLQLLDATDIRHVGGGHTMDESYAPLVLEKDGERVAILNLCEAEFGVMKDGASSAGYAWIGHPSIDARIRALKEEGLYVILYVHAGLECQPFPLAEWQEQYHAFVDAGADIVIAAHPHIIQGIEEYHGRRIYYSLGNFYFDDEELGKSGGADWNMGLAVHIDTESGVQRTDIWQRTPDGLQRMEQDAAAELLADRSRRLTDGTLAAWTDEVAQECWEAYYRQYYFWAVRSPLYTFARNVWRRLRLRPPAGRIDDTFLLHNISNETHHAVVTRVLYRENLRENGLLR